jgi:hypothetical protein
LYPTTSEKTKHTTQATYPKRENDTSQVWEEVYWFLMVDKILAAGKEDGYRWQQNQKDKNQYCP